MLYEETEAIRQMALHSVYNGIVPDLVALLRQVTFRLNGNGQGPRELDQPKGPSVRANTRHAVVETLKLIPMRDQVELVQVLRCLTDVMSNTNELNEATILNAVNLLKDIKSQATVLLKASSHGMNFDINPNVLNLAVKTVSSVMTALASSHALFVQTKRRERFYRQISDGIVSLVEDLIALQLQVQSVGETPVQVTSPFLSIHASYLHIGQHQPVHLQDVQFHLPNTTVSLVDQWSSSSHPTRNDHNNGSKAGRNVTSKNDVTAAPPEPSGHQMDGDVHHDDWGQCFQSRAISFQSDPYSLIPGFHGTVQTAVASLELYTCDGSQRLNVNDLPQSNLLRIDIQRQQQGSNDSSTFGASSHFLNKTSMNIHRMLMSGQNGPQTGFSNDPSRNRFLHIHIHLEKIPSGLLAFPLLVIISPVSVPHNIHDHIFKQIYNQTVHDIKIILPATSIIAGKSYNVGIAEASFNSGRRRNIEVAGHHYNFSAWWDTCVYWDVKEGSWKSEGCQVLESSSLQVLHCRCNHLTSFAGFYELIPHSLTVVSVDEFFSPHENPLIIVIVGTVLLAYIVIMVMMQPKVKNDDDAKRRERVVFLQDNCSSHRQKYEIVMETGIHPDAGTTSKVSLILHGDEGVSETRELTTTDNGYLFERNSRNRFIITLPETSGRISKIQLWHNNSGSSPGWFLRQVIVRDLNSGLTFYFLCQRWLSVDRDDGKIEREFQILDGSAITFSQVFLYKGSQYLSDLHTWLSIFTCPPHSRFTRIQRLFLCLALLMSYMGLATLWFHMEPPVIRGEFGLLDLSWKNILTGAGICCIMFPVNIFLAFLFRRSCVNTRISRVPEIPGGKHGLDLVSQGEEDLPQGSVPYSILDQSILNWQHIQEWAHKQWQKRQSHVISSTDAIKDSHNRHQQSTPSMVPLVQQTMLAGEDDTELGSSGFEDATSQATAERHRIIATSDISSMDKKSGSEPSGPIHYKRKLLFPWWCRYIAWVLCFLFIAGGAATTVWYGFRFSHRRSVMWIQSVYFSLITCVFIVQPIMIFVKSLCTSVRHCHNPAVFDMDPDVEEDLDLEWEERRKQEMNAWQEEDEIQQGLAARTRSRYLRFAGPLQEKQLKSSRRKMVKEKKALSLLRQGIILTLLTLFLLILAFGRNRSQQVHLNQAAFQMFAGNLGDKSSFMNINSLSDWYKWSRNILVPSLCSMDTLATDHQKHNSPGTSELGILIGSVQLRQLRVRPQPCMSVRPLGTARTRCFHDYSQSAEDADYSMSGHWQFDDLHPSLWGYMAWYGNDGYLLPLGHSRNELVNQFDGLESSHWLNHQTRAVFMELTVYNAPSRLYGSITLLLEVSASGKVLPSAHIRSSQLFHYVTLWEECLLACELLLMVILIGLFSRVAQKIFHQRLSYFKQFWNCKEMLMCLVSLMYILFVIYRFILVMEIVEKLRSSFYEEFVSFTFLTMWDEVLHTLLGLLLFCVLVKWISIVSYNPTIARLLLSYKRSQRQIVLAAALFGVQTLAFSSLGHVLFGCVYRPMYSFMSSVMSVTALSARILNLSEMADSFSIHILSIFCVFTYVFLHGLICVYLVSVLTYRLKRVKNKKRLSMPPKKLLHFYWDYLCKQTSSKKKDPQPQESENSLSPEFIMAEILYLVEELLFRMNNLLGTSGLPEKQHSFTDSDSSPDAGDDGISTGGSEEINIVHSPPLEDETTEIIDFTRLEDRVHRIEDKLCSNEPYLAQLLKLDSFGANILSEEQEQALRSQLEFEIFQQLQKQRQETPDLDCPNCPESKSKLESPKIITSAPNSNNKDGVSSVTHKNNSKNMRQINPTETSPAVQHLKTQPEIKSPELFPEVETKNSTKVHSTLPVITTKSLKRSQSLKVPTRDTSGIFDTSSGLKKTRQGFLVDMDSNLQAKLLMNRHSSVKGKKEMMAIDRLTKKDPKLLTTTSILRKPLRLGETMERDTKELVPLSHKLSSGNVSPQSSEGERGHKRTDSSSGQSGADTRLDTPKMVGKRLDLPPKPTFTHNSILSPPKARQLDLMGEWTAAESSSGSEQEAGLASKRMCVGRRNLRKTKSRGKGKGNDVDIDSAIVLSEDFQSRTHRGISDCSIIIHPVPAHVDLDEISIPEEV